MPSDFNLQDQFARFVFETDDKSKLDAEQLNELKLKLIAAIEGIFEDFT